MWACRASGGRVGRFRSAVVVACIVVPLGVAMAMGGTAGCMLVTGVVGVQKCEVQPESAMAVVGEELEVGGLIVALV